MIQSGLWLLIGVLTLGAAIESWYNDNPKIALISVAYALADFVLAAIGE